VTEELTPQVAALAEELGWEADLDRLVEVGLVGLLDDEFEELDPAIREQVRERLGDAAAEQAHSCSGCGNVVLTRFRPDDGFCRSCGGTLGARRQAFSLAVPSAAEAFEAPSVPDTRGWGVADGLSLGRTLDLGQDNEDWDLVLERAAKEEEERLRKEEEERLRKEEEERQRLEAERLRKEEEERQRQEAERLRKEEEERQRLEAERLRKEEEERQRQEAERLRKEEEERQRLEAERLRKEEEERQRKALEERARKQEEERLRREEAARARRAEEERARQAAEQKQREEAAARRREEEQAKAAERKRKAEERRREVERQMAERRRKEHEVLKKKVVAQRKEEKRKRELLDTLLPGVPEERVEAMRESAQKRIAERLKSNRKQRRLGRGGARGLGKR
jgi:DNA repair exonuclease SbcCD ATPase subunit